MTQTLARPLLIVAGLFVCFRGYPVFRFGLGFTAFLVGAYAVSTRHALFAPDPAWLALAGVAAAGLFLAVLVLAIYRVGIFLLGVCAGILAAIKQRQHIPAYGFDRGLTLVVAGIMGGLLPRMAERLAFTAGTVAVRGLMIGSAAIPQADGLIPLGARAPNLGDLPANSLFLGTWATLTMLEFAVQLGLSHHRGHTDSTARL